MERDERDSLRELLSSFMLEQSSGVRMKLQSELEWEPPVDVIETGKEVIVVVDIAGMEGKDISVVTDGEILRISGFRKNVSPKEKKQFHKLEIQVGHFSREIELPVPVDHSGISACYNNGMLEIRVRKLDLSERVKRIRIE
jgi:HSP20 family protein